MLKGTYLHATVVCIQAKIFTIILYQLYIIMKVKLLPRGVINTSLMSLEKNKRKMIKVTFLRVTEIEITIKEVS